VKSLLSSWSRTSNNSASRADARALNGISASGDLPNNARRMNLTYKRDVVRPP
jgi:hypothetical protein